VERTKRTTSTMEEGQRENIEVILLSLTKLSSVLLRYSKYLLEYYFVKDFTKNVFERRVLFKSAKKMYIVN
jgi:hypothetical protein